MGVKPSDLNQVFWSHTREDIRTVLRLKVAAEQTRITQDFQTLSTVLSYALGGKKSKGKPPSSLAEAEAQLMSLFGGQ